MTFNPGEASKTASVTILDDSLAEGNETFALTLGNPVNAVLTANGQALGTIVDNEVSSCRTPSYNMGVTAATCVWKDCTSGAWFARFTSGGSASTVTYVGNVLAEAPFASVTPYSIEPAYDTLDTSDPSRTASTSPCRAGPPRASRYRSRDARPSWARRRRRYRCRSGSISWVRASSLAGP